MQTTYYSLAARRLTVRAVESGRRASGQQESVCYAFVPRRRPSAPAPRGVVLDFPAPRRAEEGEELPPVQERSRSARTRAGRLARAGLWADLAVSGALAVSALGVLVSFFVR